MLGCKIKSHLILFFYLLVISISVVPISLEATEDAVKIEEVDALLEQYEKDFFEWEKSLDKTKSNSNYDDLKNVDSNDDSQLSFFKNYPELSSVTLDGLPQKMQPPRMNWCWASTAQMAIEYRLKKKVSLCGMVSKVLNLDCCKKNNLEACNQKGNPGNAAALYGLRTTSDFPSVWAVHQAMLQKKVPIIRLRNVFDDTHHVATVKEIRKEGKEFLIYDPYEGALVVSRSRMESGDIYGQHEWVSTYVVW